MPSGGLWSGVRPDGSTSTSSALARSRWGLPFMPTMPAVLAGHDLHRGIWGNKLGVVTSPFEAGQLVSVVRPIRPELGVFHVQRVDCHGNAQMLGPTAELRQAVGACRRVVVIAEELVPTELVRERPELTVVPGHMVEAVIVEPWAAHPTDSSGYYSRDLEHHAYYGRISRTTEGFEEYLASWVHGVDDHAGYIARLGSATLDSLRLREPWWSR